MQPPVMPYPFDLKYLGSPWFAFSIGTFIRQFFTNLPQGGRELPA
jgi:hypothetical protein